MPEQPQVNHTDIVISSEPRDFDFLPTYIRDHSIGRNPKHPVVYPGMLTDTRTLHLLFNTPYPVNLIAIDLAYKTEHGDIYQKRIEGKRDIHEFPTSAPAGKLNEILVRLAHFGSSYRSTAFQLLNNSHTLVKAQLRGDNGFSTTNGLEPSCLLMIGNQEATNSDFALQLEAVQIGGVVGADHHMPELLPATLIGCDTVPFEPANQLSKIVPYDQVFAIKKSQLDKESIKQICDLDTELIRTFHGPSKASRWINGDYSPMYVYGTSGTTIPREQRLLGYDTVAKEYLLPSIVDYVFSPISTDRLEFINKQIDQLGVSKSYISTRLRHWLDMPDLTELNERFQTLFSDHELKTRLKEKYPHVSSSIDKIDFVAELHKKRKKIAEVLGLSLED